MSYHRNPLSRAQVAATIKTLALVGAAVSVGVSPLLAAQTGGPPPGVKGSIKGSGTPGFLPEWATSTKLGNSALFQAGSGASSRIGLNVTSPGAAFHVVAPNQVGLLLDAPAATIGSGLDLRTTGTGGRQWEMLATGNTAAQGAGKLNIRDVNDGSDRFTINSSGQVGISNTNPAAALDVVAPNQSGIFVKGPVSGVGSGIDLFTTGSGGKQWEVLATGNSASGNQGPGNFNIRDIATGTDYFTIRTDGSLPFTRITGDLEVLGLVFTEGPCVSGCARSKRVRYYAPRAAAPVSEDFGTAQMSNGRAFVSLDPAFAAGIERNRPYLVFLTPQADSEGLYVASKTTAGFVVAEMRGGRHTLAFDYRIVAQDAGAGGKRVAIVNSSASRR